ncbi:MAG TPA: hypothetical protein VGM75_37545 [Pseudonocardiaceae bacterium]
MTCRTARTPVNGPVMVAGPYACAKLSSSSKLKPSASPAAGPKVRAPTVNDPDSTRCHPSDNSTATTSPGVTGIGGAP